MAHMESSQRPRFPLPRDGTLYLTEGGQETEVLYRHGHELPEFALFPLLDDPAARADIEAMYRSYLEVAVEHGCVALMGGLDYRASPDWAGKLGYSAADLEAVQLRCIAFLRELAAPYAERLPGLLIAGIVGPRGDAYELNRTLTAEEAEEYHGVQLATLAAAGVDLVEAMTFNSVAEAVGIARAAARAGLPLAILFTVDPAGHLASGESLREAVEAVDAQTGEDRPDFYGINCSHPVEFAPALEEGDWIRRVRAIRPNAALMDKVSLCRIGHLEEGDPPELGRQLAELARRFPHVDVWGGCCGTWTTHLEEIAREVRRSAPLPGPAPEWTRRRGGAARPRRPPRGASCRPRRRRPRLAPVRRFTPDERRARLGVRHRLAADARATDPVAAADAVVGLHGTDAASVFLAVQARTRGLPPADTERALYEDRALVRVMGMRRTMWVAPARTAGLVLAACGRGVAGAERRKLLKLVAGAELEGVPADPTAWLARLEARALELLREHGELTAPELAAHDPDLARVLVLAPGTRYEARQKLVSRVLTVLGAEGAAVRTRPRGSWTSTQFRWAALDAWAPEALPPEDTVAARAALAARWLRAFGPAPEADLQWWTGWNRGHTRAALAANDAVEVDCAGVPGVALPDDLEPTPEPAPWAALLPALDPTTMGWKDRAFTLGAHEPRLFDTNGNAGPTVWWSGRVVGGWAQRAGGEVVTHLLEDAGAEAAEAIAQEAARLQELLGDVRLAPRARGRSAVEAGLVR